jgi:hypothetical protein
VTSQERAAAWFTKVDELLREAEVDLGGPGNPYGEAFGKAAQILQVHLAALRDLDDLAARRDLRDLQDE